MYPPFCQCSTPDSPSPSNLLSPFRLLRIFSLCPLTTSWMSLLPSCFLFYPDSLRVLQWNAGSLRPWKIELLHFLSSHPADLTCIQQSNLTSSSSFRILEFSALQFYPNHSRSGIFSPDATQTCGGVIIFVRQGLSFSELSTSSRSLLDPYSLYIGVNISLNDFSSLSFLNVCAPFIRSSPSDSRTNYFFPPFFPPPPISSFRGTSIAITPL